ncbi:MULTISPECIES: preprotein translocase subunit SecG [Marivita]|jgi:preprotein translocase subunit SecG|uniref:Protein-export membrane protein SecG n=1 Tax=Marivita cryptomonadis TaxID=505252 RepID=A0A9Q2NSV4_9RHOB|nr:MULTISPECIES: preprotein translocase subunit SecG [Marivita]MCR9169001.1 preprotein translocase subunit SecG [Paracoccaceae bacterium]MBM2320364.1 preprotein translocase subunit SecG [Marivita cryptomonadis]MBM2329944.1 preprotein translocase subunit SecG [Marivita cryptomonadis]MBM2339531.1 preprotein translocase subunit SecG [Marivita cryptomonadis]MBM2344190.1 preprotein translocase subunit SecG [Marivita cryptomonadis]
MENVVLIIHLLLALALIGVVLLQRSDGGGLGAMGGGGGGAVSTRSAATGLGKLTWILAIAFICTSLTLTVIAAQNASGSSIMDRLTTGGDTSEETTTDGLDADGLLPPPSSIDPNAPLLPRAD